MGGEIRFQSVQGKGSEFWFELEFGLATVKDVEKKVLNVTQVRGIIISAEKNTNSLLDYLSI